MQPIKAEAKPENRSIGTSLMFNPSDQAEVSAELQKSIGEAINKMFNPDLANMHSEITEREKILLKGLYIKGIAYYKPNQLNNYPRIYQADHYQKGVITNRARAKEMVEILREINMSHSPRGILAGIRNKLAGE